MSTTPNSIEAQWIDLSVGDKRMSVYQCKRGAGNPKGAVIVLQEIFGVNPHIRSVTERVAAEGYLALAPDLFHRQGDRFECDYPEMKKAVERMQKMHAPQTIADITQIIESLAQELRVGVVGFCMGGRLAFELSTHARVSGVVSYYGGRIATTSLHLAPQVQCPILFFFGEEDKHIPQSEVAQIRETLHEHSKEEEIVIYPGADHAFFCEARASYNEQAAQDSWKRFKAFLARQIQRRP